MGPCEGLSSKHLFRLWLASLGALLLLGLVVASLARPPAAGANKERLEGGVHFVKPRSPPTSTSAQQAAF
jgi:hypothetical protein